VKAKQLDRMFAMTRKDQIAGVKQPRPVTHSRTTSSAWLQGVANTLRAQGLDLAALFRDAGLSVAELDDPEHRWPTEEVNRLWALAVERSGNPAVALTNPHLARPDHYGVVGYAMMSSPDLLTGLERLIRYLRIVSDAVSISLDPGKGGRWVKLDFFGSDSPVPRQRYEYAILTLLTFCRWMLGKSLKPVVAAFSYPAPVSLAPYNEASGCPLKFNSDSNAFLVSDTDLGTKLSTSIPQLAEIHDRIAGLALRKLGLPETMHRAREAITSRLQDGTPRRSTIASDLRVGDHTLQRRLMAEKTSFTQLIDDTRRELTQHHLADLRTSLSEITFLLGYSDQSTLFRACLRWFGEPPGEHRARLASTSPCRKPNRHSPVRKDG
jgi:AraC-like DNA-binding protein